MFTKIAITTPALLFTMAAMIGLGVSHTEDAGAATELSPASLCFIDEQYDTDYLYRDGIANNSSGWNWGPRNVYCAITDTPERPRATITSMKVSGFDGNVQAGDIHDFQAKICLTDTSPGYTTHYAYCSSTAVLNLSLSTNLTFDYLLPSAVSQVATWWSMYMANLVVQIPAHNGTPSIYYGHKLIY